MKCLQKYNIFGFWIPPCEEADRGHSYHVGVPSGEQVSRACQNDPEKCSHHEPIWDEFDLWVQEVRRKAAGL